MTERPPALWINLERAVRRRRRMTWALDQGGWRHERLAALDAGESSLGFRARPVLRCAGSRFPGVRRLSEDRPFRRTTRSELACLASWQLAVARAGHLMDESGSDHLLVLEDDVGSTLATPDAWPVSLDDIIRDAVSRTDEHGDRWTAIQLAPVSARARKFLHETWNESGKVRLTVPKSTIRSHGNGAVLLHRRALIHLDQYVRTSDQPGRIRHLRHPWGVRPVADKWIYACLPKAGVLVSTVPLFCLDATDSDVHGDHVDTFHRSSRETTLELWKQDGLIDLIKAQDRWDAIS